MRQGRNYKEQDSPRMSKNSPDAPVPVPEETSKSLLDE